MNLPDAFRAYIHSTNGLRSEHEHYTVDTWNAALEAAAVRLEEFAAFMDKEVRPALNDFGKAIHDAQHSNQRSCIEAIRQLKIENAA